MKSRNHIFLYYSCGVFAAAQLGKLAALAPLISRDLHLGLAAMAALTSLLEVSGALLGGAAGQWLPRVGMLRGLVLASLCLALGAAGAAFAHGTPMLVFARLVESMGYLLTVVAAPVLIANVAPPGRQAAAMSLWSTFVPVGAAVGTWTYAHAAGLGDWRWAQGLSVIVGIGLCLTLLATQRKLATSTPAATTQNVHERQPTGAILWALVAAFGTYAMAETGLLVLMPSLLTQRGLSLTQAGSWTAMAALANVPASMLGAWLMRRGGVHGSWLAAFIFAPGLLFPLVYQTGTAALWVVLGAVWINVLSGVFASLVFALLPRAAGTMDRLSMASGRLTQFGASGALLGPPAVGWVVERSGWTAAGFVSLGLCVVSAGLAMWASSRGQFEQVRRQGPSA